MARSGGPSIKGGLIMSIDTRWRLTVDAAALIVCVGLVGSAANAEEAGDRGTPVPEARPGTSEAVAGRFDALLEKVTARLAAEKSGGAAPGAEVANVRAELAASRAKIEVLNAVVVEALVAQYEVEADLRSARRDGAAQVSAVQAEREEADARNLMLADQLEALADRLALLQAEVDTLRTADAAGPRTMGPAADSRSVAEAPAPQAVQSSSFQIVATASAAPIGDLLPYGDGGQPLVDEVSLAAVDRGVEPAAAPDDQIEVGQVHFNPGSAALTPGAERKTLEAAGRIQSMDVEVVRVVGYSDTMGGADGNQHLSLRRADTIAALLEDIGIPRAKIEIVGRGEDGIPEPTPDQVSEPLNRCAGIFVVTAYPK